MECVLIDPKNEHPTPYALGIYRHLGGGRAVDVGVSMSIVMIRYKALRDLVRPALQLDTYGVWYTLNTWPPNYASSRWHKTVVYTLNT